MYSRLCLLLSSLLCAQATETQPSRKEFYGSGFISIFWLCLKSFWGLAMRGLVPILMYIDVPPIPLMLR